MFGLPTAVVSIVCYSLCCMEVTEDAPDEDSEYDEEEENLPKEIDQGYNISKTYSYLS
jgi:hypothetical protein